jgi:hypothetical protein
VPVRLLARWPSAVRAVVRGTPFDMRCKQPVLCQRKSRIAINIPRLGDTPSRQHAQSFTPQPGQTA